MLRPSRVASWLAPITNAAALVNPERTGVLRKFTRNPTRATPITTCTTPTSSANSSASATYSAVPWGASAPTLVAVIRDTIATGPTASVRLVPKTA